MNKSEKILACYGYVDCKSTSLMVGCAYTYVYYVLRINGLTPLPTYSPRAKSTRYDQ